MGEQAAVRHALNRVAPFQWHTAPIGASTAHMTERYQLTVQGRCIDVLGIAHVGTAGAEAVEKLLREVKPDVVCLDLESDREANTRRDTPADVAKLVALDPMVGLASMHPGTKDPNHGRAVRLALAEGETRIERLGRASHITLSRWFAPLAAIDRLKLMVSMFSERCNQVDEDVEGALEHISEGEYEELVRQQPFMFEAIISERARLILHRLARVEGTRVVAVLSLLVARELRRLPEAGDVSTLCDVPRSTPTLIRRGVVAAAGCAALLMAGMSRGALVAWAAGTGGVALLGALVAGAHVATIVVAAALAPLATLIPFVDITQLLARTECKLRPLRQAHHESVPLGASKWTLRSHPALSPFATALLVDTLLPVGALIATICMVAR